MSRYQLINVHFGVVKQDTLGILNRSLEFNLLVITKKNTKVDTKHGKIAIVIPCPYHPPHRITCRPDRVFHGLHWSPENALE